MYLIIYSSNKLLNYYPMSMNDCWSFLFLFFLLNVDQLIEHTWRNRWWRESFELWWLFSIQNIHEGIISFQMKHLIYTDVNGRGSEGGWRPSECTGIEKPSSRQRSVARVAALWPSERTRSWDLLDESYTRTAASL
jgi:hypothetical protein